MIQNTSAIILHGRKFSDSSKIITAFTKDHGKISLIAKGALKPKNKFGSSIEPINCSNIDFYVKNSGLHLLSNAEQEINLRNIKRSYEHTAVAMMIMEAISQTKIDSDHSPELFSITLEVLKELNKLKENPFNYFVFFQLIHAQLLGFGVNTDFEDHNDILRFAPEHGTYIENIRTAARKLIIFPKDAARILDQINNTSLDELEKIKYNWQTLVKIFDFFVEYYSFHFDKPIKYTSFSLLETNL